MKMQSNAIIDLLSGKFGRMVFKHRGSRGYIAKAPRRYPKSRSAKQQETRLNFKMAIQAAKGVLADPVARAPYEGKANSTKKPILSFIVEDYIGGPHLAGIDLSSYEGRAGSKITVISADDFKITDVEVTITSADGGIIESGHAVPAPSGSSKWEYTASEPAGSASVTVTATAGNRFGKKETIQQSRSLE